MSIYTKHMSKERYSTKRPLGITIMALIFLIYGLLLLVFGSWIFGILTVVISIGLLEGSSLARIIVIIILILLLILNILEVDILSIILYLIMLFYMTERKVKHYFS